MTQPPIVSVKKHTEIFKVGMQVVHLSRLDVGDGRVTKIYQNGYCDVEFADCKFSWIPPDHFCSLEEFLRLQQERRRQARMALEIARAREAQQEREASAKRELFRKIRNGLRLSSTERELLSVLSVSEQLVHFASSNSVSAFVDDLIPILGKASADKNLSEAFAKFWNAHPATADLLPLMPVAPQWWRERLWCLVHFDHLSFQEKLITLSGTELQVREDLRKELIQELVDAHSFKKSFDEILAKASIRVRFEVLVNINGNLLPRFLAHTLQLLLDAANAKPGTFPSGLVDEFWARHGTSIPRRSQIFALAPIRIQRQILCKHFDKHLQHLEQLFDHNSETSGNWPAAVVYGELDADDHSLAERWCSGSNSGYDIARMLSARAAEKVAAWFYDRLGYETADISKYQLSGKSDAWVTHDLLLNGSEPVDVKNARLPLNSRAFYVEHTVPQFKRDRRGRGVTIVAVVSPYLALEYLQDADSAPFEVSDVRYLGETNLDAIKQLCETFGSGALTVNDPADGAFIPPWYFNFPDAWYREFEFLCSELRNSESPDAGEMRLLYEDNIAKFPIAKFIAAQLPLPKWLLEAMEPWMRALVGQLQSACRPRPQLAHLFLLLLTDFLSKLRDVHVESFEPSAYLRLLFEGGSLSESTASHRPLGIEDPLGTIRTLCESLQLLWTSREHLDLQRFRQYRLSGGGILQGREWQGVAWETVLSYCGGRVEGKGRCGFTPLILGVETQCPVCRKLVCLHCGYCSERCARTAAAF